MGDYLSVLRINHLVFDSISFKRFGFKNTNNDIEFKLNAKVGQNKNGGDYRVTLELTGIKPDEYEINIQLSGFFSIDKSQGISDDDEKILLQKNAVAIMMPYMRSEVSVLTAQLETDSVIFPVINVNHLFEDSEVVPK